MKHLRVFAFTMLTVLFFSCNKEEHLDIDMTIISSGSLTVNFVNDAGVPISGVNVEISSNCNSAFNEAKTGDDGKVFFDNIIEGVYCVQAEDVVVNGVEYEVQRFAMIAAGKNTEITINPLEYTAQLKLKLQTSYYNYSSRIDTVVSNANIGLISTSDYYGSTHDFNDLVSKIVVAGKTDNNGEVTLSNAPIGRYYVLVYYDEGHFELNRSSFILNKGDELNRTIELNYESLFDLHGNISLYLYTRTYSRDTIKVANANVILTKSSYSSYNSAVNYAVAEGVTDENGNITFNDLDVDNYYVHVYYTPSRYDRAYSSYHAYLNATTHYDVEMDENDLGL